MHYAALFFLGGMLRRSSLLLNALHLLLALCSYAFYARLCMAVVAADDADITGTNKEVTGE